MNVFVVPSWYPSGSNPSYGIFIKEQVEMLARLRPEWNFGISTWGQGDPNKLIWANDLFKNLSKISAHGKDRSDKHSSGNITTYYQPALSWSKKIRRGNLKEIIRCNELNLQAFKMDYGDPKIIWVQATYPGVFIANFLSRRYKAPYITHVRLGGYMFESLLKDLGFMKKKFLNHLNSSNEILHTSNFQAQQLEKRMRSNLTIANPVDTDFFIPADAQSDASMLAIGRLEHEKGFDLLIKAMSHVEEGKLKIIGEGSERKNLAQLIKKHSLQDRITLLGEKNREEVRSEIQACAFLILPSRYETFGNVLLEALACGKPVVATLCGGPQDIVTSECGYVADVDAEDLASKINLMQNNRNLFEAEDIRNYVELKFSPKKWANQIEEKFKNVASRLF